MLETDLTNYTTATTYTTTYTATTTSTNNTTAWAGNYIYDAINRLWTYSTMNDRGTEKRTKKHHVDIDREKLLAFL